MDHRDNAHPWRLRQVPVAAVSNRHETLALAPGSEIDLDVLEGEIRQLDSAGYHVSTRLVVDDQATLIDPSHQQAEREADLTGWIGSTGKGIGAARAARAMRKARLVQDLVHDGELFQRGDVAWTANRNLANGGQVLIEGTQGYALGLHAGHYPQCTSSDCTAMDFLAMAGLAPWALGTVSKLEIWVVFRTYPIRVAGNSGPLANELTWDELGLPPEHTTVTRKVRRVGQWDAPLARRAMQANGHHGSPHSPVHAAVTMADYVIPELAGLWNPKELPDHKQHAWDRFMSAHSADIGRAVELVGTGPATMIDLRNSLRYS
jgi:adenylosuccinate synthase